MAIMMLILTIFFSDGGCSTFVVQPASNVVFFNIIVPVQVLNSTPTNRRMVQPVTYRDQSINSVIQLLFKLGGSILMVGYLPYSPRKLFGVGL